MLPAHDLIQSELAFNSNISNTPHFVTNDHFSLHIRSKTPFTSFSHFWSLNPNV